MPRALSHRRANTMAAVLQPRAPRAPRTGDEVDIAWDDRDEVFRGRLERRISKKQRRKAYPFEFEVLYEDGDAAIHDLDTMRWRYAESRRWYLPGDLADVRSVTPISYPNEKPGKQLQQQQQQQQQPQQPQQPQHQQQQESNKYVDTSKCDLNSYIHIPIPQARVIETKKQKEGDVQKEESDSRCDTLTQSNNTPVTSQRTSGNRNKNRQRAVKKIIETDDDSESSAEARLIPEKVRDDVDVHDNKDSYYVHDSNAEDNGEIASEGDHAEDIVTRKVSVSNDGSKEQAVPLKGRTSVKSGKTDNSFSPLEVQKPADSMNMEEHDDDDDEENLIEHDEDADPDDDVPLTRMLTEQINKSDERHDDDKKIKQNLKDGKSNKSNENNDAIASEADLLTYVPALSDDARVEEVDVEDGEGEDDVEADSDTLEEANTGMEHDRIDIIIDTNGDANGNVSDKMAEHGYVVATTTVASETNAAEVIDKRPDWDTETAIAMDMTKPTLTAATIIKVRDLTSASALVERYLKRRRTMLKEDMKLPLLPVDNILSEPASSEHDKGGKDGGVDGGAVDVVGRASGSAATTPSGSPSYSVSTAELHHHHHEGGGAEGGGRVAKGGRATSVEKKNGNGDTDADGHKSWNDVWNYLRDSRIPLRKRVNMARMHGVDPADL